MVHGGILKMLLLEKRWLFHLYDGDSTQCVFQRGSLGKNWSWKNFPSHAKLCPPDCWLSCTDWIWAHLILIFPPLLSELQFICPNSLLILQVFLTPALLCKKHHHPHTPLLPSSLASCLSLTLSPPLNSFLLSVISLLPLISLATSVLSSPAFPCFLLSTSVMFAPDPPSLLFLTFRRRVFLSLVHIYIPVANQQLLSVVHFPRSLVRNFRRAPLNDACLCQCCDAF